MNDGIKILLERVKTHPEEFCEDETIPTNARWSYVMRVLNDLGADLTAEEQEAFKALNVEIKGIRKERRRQRFTELVLEALVEEPPHISSATLSTKGRIAYGIAPAKPEGSSITYDTSMLNELKEAIKEMHAGKGAGQ